MSLFWPLAHLRGGLSGPGPGQAGFVADVIGLVCGPRTVMAKGMPVPVCGMI